MKLNETRPFLESSGEMQEQFFAIEDQGMIFDILRNKMYGNPILAICREISCNARDAQREVGNEKTPVHISLPNNLEPYYKIRDFGPGISPDRMSNIFIKYTASTKRKDNIQTGGFGLGAKTPFSYSDTFSIVTVHDGIKYNYNCVIDETKVGKLLLLDRNPTKEKNGTEIMIPVLPKNFQDFNNYTEQACRHWDVKPIIKGGNIAWQKFETLLEGDKWAITKIGYNANRNTRLIIDGIEYPLDLATLRNYADTKLIDAAQGGFVMYFGVGELSLSASRESVYLDEKTQKVIRSRLLAIQNEIKTSTLKKIDDFTNLWDANVYYNKALRTVFNNLSFLGNLTWRGTTLLKDSFWTDTPVYAFAKGKYSRKYGTDPNKLSRSSGSNIRFDDNTVILFNDLPVKDPTPRFVRKAFDDNPALMQAYVICPTDKIDFAMLDKRFNLTKMNVVMLSSITKATGRAYTPPAQRVLVFKYDERANAWRQSSYAALEEDKNTIKVLASLHKGYAEQRSDSTLSISALNVLLGKYKSISFYGLDEDVTQERIDKDFSDLTPAQTFIKDTVLNNPAINFIELKFISKYSRHANQKLVNFFDTVKKDDIVSPTSLFTKALNLNKKMDDMQKKDCSLLALYETIHGKITEHQIDDFLQKNPDLDIAKTNSIFEKTYPLLSHIYDYDYSGIPKHVIHYVNLVDKEKN